MKLKRCQKDSLPTILWGHTDKSMSWKKALTQPFWYPDLGLPVFRTEKNKFLLIKPSPVFWGSSLNRLRQGPLWVTKYFERNTMPNNFVFLISRHYLIKLLIILRMIWVSPYLFLLLILFDFSWSSNNFLYSGLVFSRNAPAYLTDSIILRAQANPVAILLIIISIISLPLSLSYLLVVHPQRNG